MSNFAQTLPSVGTYESKTQEIARRILQNTDNKGSFWAKLKENINLEDKIMAWSMGNDGLRVQLFRLIDCLPSLHSKPEIARHMQEYLANDAVNLPALKSILGFSTDDPNSFTATTAATVFSCRRIFSEKVYLRSQFS